VLLRPALPVATWLTEAGKNATNDGRKQPLLKAPPHLFQRADNKDSVNLPLADRTLLADYSAGTEGDFVLSMAGVNSGYPRLEVGAVGGAPWQW
jgi:hypothetical protein